VTDHQFIKAERVPSSPSIANKIQGEAMSEEYAKRFRPYQFMMNSGYDEFKTMEGDRTLAVIHCSYLRVKGGHLDRFHVTKTLLLAPQIR
jgi:hypothetical protein